MNNGEDFPREMLTDVYNNIQDREIILPSEHSGAVKESYEWKVCHTGFCSNANVDAEKERGSKIFLATKLIPNLTPSFYSSRC